MAALADNPANRKDCAVEDLEQKLTIVLPVRDRTAYTFRWLSYANHIGLRSKVIIADGGADPALEQALTGGNSFPNLRCDYLRCPYDSDFTAFFRKMAAAVARVDTPYVVMESNDDFYLIEARRRAIDFLDRNPDHAAATGATIDYRVVADEAQFGDLSQIYGSIGFPGRVYLHKSLTHERAIDRLWAFVTKNANAVLWSAVHRTENLRRICEAQCTLSWGDAWLSDVFVLFMTIALGKTSGDMGSYFLHQDNTRDSMGLTAAQENPTILHWIQRPQWPEAIGKLVQSTAEIVAQVDGIPLDQALDAVEQIYLFQVGMQVANVMHPNRPGRRATGGDLINLAPQEIQAMVAEAEINRISGFFTQASALVAQKLREAAAG